mmetsp:Transcript_10458/g.19119  ORF Transcript_10458/g.19119 Transcript_10458/m.19119 type:complete len:91 (-) Transcript_10458:6-278(-)
MEFQDQRKQKQKPVLQYQGKKIQQKTITISSWRKLKTWDKLLSLASSQFISMISMDVSVFVYVITYSIEECFSILGTKHYVGHNRLHFFL